MSVDPEVQDTKQAYEYAADGPETNSDSTGDCINSPDRSATPSCSQPPPPSAPYPPNAVTVAKAAAKYHLEYNGSVTLFVAIAGEESNWEDAPTPTSCCFGVWEDYLRPTTSVKGCDFLEPWTDGEWKSPYLNAKCADQVYLKQGLGAWDSNPQCLGLICSGQLVSNYKTKNVSNCGYGGSSECYLMAENAVYAAGMYY
jgi:hypothetical protein